jgi:hypothetical protein
MHDCLFLFSKVFQRGKAPSEGEAELNTSVLHGYLSFGDLIGGFPDRQLTHILFCLVTTLVRLRFAHICENPP